MKSTRGFTIVELLVTLGIVAMVLAMAAPSFTSLIRDTRISSRANLFVTAMNLARIEAVKRRVKVTVAPKGATVDEANWANGYNIVAEDGIFSRELPADGTDVTLQSVGGYVKFVYLPNGRIEGLVGSDILNLCDIDGATEGREITVSGTGRVAVKRKSC